MKEQQSNNSGGVGGALVAIVIILGILGLVIWAIGYFGDSNSLSSQELCAVREQDKTLELYYYSKGLQPTSEQTQLAYKQALQVCE